MGTAAVILAGGRGTRMGGCDKGWLRYRGRPLIEHVLARIEPQVDAVVISCNRHLDDYRQLGWPVVEDDDGGSLGPLAGIAAAAAQCRHSWVQLSPCDTPLLPPDLTARLRSAALAAGAQAAIPTDGLRRHYLCSLVARPALALVPELLGSGDLAVRGWLQRLRLVEVAWTSAEAFVNINTPGQLPD
jgi:molybdopterin-guanine dinucleotide biosynthesis protein A